jgi:recombination protein RecT
MPAPPRGSPRTAPPPPSKEVAKTGKGTLSDFIETYEGDFARVMPGHVNVNAFVGLAAAYVRRDDKLRQAAQANPASLILALRECAALGHTPTPKIFALVPFRVSAREGKPAGWNITGIETYHGVIERMYRAGGVQAVKCELVRRNDDFRWDAMTQRVARHEYDPFATEEQRGELMGVYAWAVLFTGGQSQVVWLNREQVMKHRAVSKSGDAFWGGPWEPDMWRKTGLHGLERYVPTSAAYRWEVAASANAAGSGFAGIPDVPVLEYGPSPDDGVEDAVIVEDPPEQRPRPMAARAAHTPPANGEPGKGQELPLSEQDAGGWPTVPSIPNGEQSS